MDPIDFHGQMFGLACRAVLQVGSNLFTQALEMACVLCGDHLFREIHPMGCTCHRQNDGVATFRMFVLDRSSREASMLSLPHTITSTSLRSSTRLQPVFPEVSRK